MSGRRINCIALNAPRKNTVGIPKARMANVLIVITGYSLSNAPSFTRDAPTHCFLLSKNGSPDMAFLQLKIPQALIQKTVFITATRTGIKTNAIFVYILKKHSHFIKTTSTKLCSHFLTCKQNLYWTLKVNLTLVYFQHKGCSIRLIARQMPLSRRQHINLYRVKINTRDQRKK